jgi:hypothetical protein
MAVFDTDVFDTGTFSPGPIFKDNKPWCEITDVHLDDVLMSATDESMGNLECVQVFCVEGDGTNYHLIYKRGVF